MEEFRVGDRVKFKPWQEMKEEFGIDGEGNIDCLYGFTPEMERSIDKDRVYTIGRIVDKRVVLEENHDFVYSMDMFYTVPTTEGDTVTHLYSRFSMPPRSVDYLSQNTVDVNLASVELNTIYRRIIKILVSEQRLYAIGVTVLDNVTLKQVQDLIDRTSAQAKYVFFCSSEDITENTVYKNSLIIKDDPDNTESLHTVLEFLAPESIYKEALINRDFEYIEKTLVEAVEKFKEKKREKEKEENINAISENFIRVAVENAQRNERVAQNDLSSAEKAYMRCLEALESAQKELLWASRAQVSEAVEEFITVLKKDQSLYGIKTSGNYIKFCVVQPLLFFSTEDYDLLKKKGYIVKECRSRGGSFRVLDAIFNREVTLILEQGFRFDASRFECKVDLDFEFHTYGIPNPHIQRFDCWGQNKPRITGALQKKDYVAAYTQAKSAIAGLNVNDDLVMGRFFECLDPRGDFKDVKCIQFPNGELMTIKEAEDYLLAKDKEEKHEED